MLRSPWWRGAAAVGAGALPALAFPAPALWWFAYGALVPWLLLVRSAGTRRRAAYDGWLGGTGFMLAVHHWLLPSLHVFTVVIAALLGALWAPWGVLARRMVGGRPSTGRAAAALVVVPSGWLVVELVRSWQGLGGPWGLLGSSQWQVAPALRLASLGGVWLVSLLVVAVNTAVVLVLRVPGARAPVVVGLLAVAALIGTAWAWAPRPEPAGVARIAVVQPGVVAGPGSGERRFAREERLTRSLADRHPDLVVWGESSVGFDLADRPDLAARLAALSRRVGADVLVNVDARRTATSAHAGGPKMHGSVAHAGGRVAHAGTPGIYKSSVLVGPHGPTGDRYDKMRLVPFGEYVPARSVLGWATSVGKAAGEDRVRGREQVLMDVGRAAEGGRTLRIGPLICFESAFPDMSRHLAADGAGVLLVQSSTSSFQHSWAPAQHASLAALRAAETGRAMVHATLTGVSAAYGPGGERIGAPLGTDTRGAVVYEVPVATGTTWYVRFGDWPVHGALLVLAVLGGAECLRSLRRPAQAPRLPPARTAHASPARHGR
ncbi:apolipoprotein N-acyltransferase [Streptomyces sulfonofaciens]|uniref:apolipoprotein N-acyltransferase n=1 Tax=Streptomyces sulfonofaciens TaxID=68272 RepID=UPI001E4D4B8B|nr:apolipoprotein N-acyltransferase [Streptomyces sulfonofaciens]